MSIELTPENEQYLDAAVASGVFHDRGQALNTAVELLKRRERCIRDVNTGIVQLEQGLGEPFDIDDIMSHIDRRLDDLRK